MSSIRNWLKLVNKALDEHEPELAISALASAVLILSERIEEKKEPDVAAKDCCCGGTKCE